MGLLVTRLELAEDLQVGEARIRQLIRRGMPVEPNGKHNIELCACWVLRCVQPDGEIGTEIGKVRALGVLGACEGAGRGRSKFRRAADRMKRSGAAGFLTSEDAGVNVGAITAEAGEGVGGVIGPGGKLRNIFLVTKLFRPMRFLQVRRPFIEFPRRLRALRKLLARQSAEGCLGDPKFRMGRRLSENTPSFSWGFAAELRPEASFAGISRLGRFSHSTKVSGSPSSKIVCTVSGTPFSRMQRARMSRVECTNEMPSQVSSRPFRRCRWYRIHCNPSEPKAHSPEIAI
jgi:hypothetical protein